MVSHSGAFSYKNIFFNYNVFISLNVKLTQKERGVVQRFFPRYSNLEKYQKEDLQCLD